PTAPNSTSSPRSRVADRSVRTSFPPLPAVLAPGGIRVGETRHPRRFGDMSFFVPAATEYLHCRPRPGSRTTPVSTLPRRVQGTLERRDSVLSLGELGREGSGVITAA